MYFKARNGTFKRVKTFANQYLEPANGGITVYYIPPYDNKTPVTAFKKVRCRLLAIVGETDLAPGFPHACWSPRTPQR